VKLHKLQNYKEKYVYYIVHSFFLENMLALDIDNHNYVCYVTLLWQVLKILIW